MLKNLINEIENLIKDDVRFKENKEYEFKSLIKKKFKKIVIESKTESLIEDLDNDEKLIDIENLKDICQKMDLPKDEIIIKLYNTLKMANKAIVSAIESNRKNIKIINDFN